MPAPIRLDGKPVGPGHAPYLIAELSGNHNGSIERAKAIISSAAQNGADCVKLQTYTAETMTIRSDRPEFQIKGGLWDGYSLYDLYDWAHTPYEWHGELFAHAKACGISCISTPFDETAVELLESVNASTPVVVGDEVFVSETYGVGSSLLKVRPGAYDVVWRDQPRVRDKAMLLHWNTPIYHEGHLYGSSGRHLSNAELRCIDWKTGAVKWSQPALGRSSLLYVDGHLICLSETGGLYLLKATPERFELVQAVELQNAEGEELLVPPAWAAPVLAHGLLYVRGDDRLVCLNLRRE